MIGIPDSVAGEKVVNYIIKKSGLQLSAVNILNFYWENMAPNKVPVEGHCVESFPPNATIKDLQWILREIATTNILGIHPTNLSRVSHFSR